MTEFLRLLSTYSPLGLIRYFRIRLMGKELLVTGSCNCCGNCCRKINLEGARGWMRSKKEFADMVKDFPEYERFVVSGKDNQGFLQFSCTWLTENGVCRNHKNRLVLCREFPDKSLHFCGGALPKGCGYLICEVRPFRKYLDEFTGSEGKQ